MHRAFPCSLTARIVTLDRDTVHERLSVNLQAAAELERDEAIRRAVAAEADCADALAAKVRCSPLWRYQVTVPVAHWAACSSSCLCVAGCCRGTGG